MFVTMTLILGHGYGNNCVLDYLQDVDLSEGVDRNGGYDNDDKNYEEVDDQIDLEGLIGSYKEDLGKKVR